MYHLSVTIHGNPDRDQGDWDWKEEHTIVASNPTELRRKVLAFQGENDIGGGNWGEATLIQEFGGGWLQIGYMSYNGRVWKTPYWDGDSEEIIL